MSAATSDGLPDAVERERRAKAVELHKLETAVDDEAAARKVYEAETEQRFGPREHDNSE